MRVLMFGWEFSPFKSGGLGTACQGMATALAKKGTEIFFVLPRAESDRPVHLPDGLTMFSASGTRVCTRSARLRREEDVREIWHDRQYTKLVPGFRDEIEEIWREKLHLEYIDSPLRPYLNSGSYLKEHRELQRLLSEKRLADPTCGPSCSMRPGAGAPSARDRRDPGTVRDPDAARRLRRRPHERSLPLCLRRGRHRRDAWNSTSSMSMTG